MIIGIGTDLVSVEEFKVSVDEQPGRYAERIFTSREIAEARDRADAYQVLAGRLAAKESFMKALGTGWTDEIDWLQIETRTDESGRPCLTLSGGAEHLASTKAVARIHVSISHTKIFATAVVVLENLCPTLPVSPVED